MRAGEYCGKLGDGRKRLSGLTRRIPILIFTGIVLPDGEEAPLTENQMSANLQINEADALRIEVSREICQRHALEWFQAMGWHLDQVSAHQARALLDLRAFRMVAEEDILSSDSQQDRLHQWTYNLSSAFRGQAFSDGMPSIVQSVEEFQVPRSYLFDTLKAIESSVYGEPIRHWEDLKRYTFRRSASFSLAIPGILEMDATGATDYFSRLAVGVGILELIQESGAWQNLGWTPVPLHWLQESRHSARQLLNGRGLRGYPELIRRLAVQAIDQLGDLPEMPQGSSKVQGAVESWVQQTLGTLHDVYANPSFVD